MSVAGVEHVGLRAPARGSIAKNAGGVDAVTPRLRRGVADARRPTPEDVFITAVKAPAANTMRITICNVGPVTQVFTNLFVRFLSFR